MSGPQHIAWFEISQRALGNEKLIDLSILVAPNEQNQFLDVRDTLIEMSRRKH
jgi:hypothetical protein